MPNNMYITEKLLKILKASQKIKSLIKSSTTGLRASVRFTVCDDLETVARMPHESRLVVQHNSSSHAINNEYTRKDDIVDDKLT